MGLDSLHFKKCFLLPAALFKTALQFLQYLKACEGVFAAGDIAHFPLKMLNGEAVSIGHWQISHKHGVYCLFIRHFATETRRKLDRVNFRKDFWDCY